MALNPAFHQWLTKRGLQPATIEALQKETILQESTLKLLTDEDLDTLRREHGLTMGQFALLRNVHGDLRGAEDDGFEVLETEDCVGLLVAADQGAATVRDQGRRPSTGKNGTGLRYRPGSAKQVYI